MRRLAKYLLILPVVVLFGACREKPQLKEEISVDPVLIEAVSALKSYKVAVTSNASWTLSAERAVSWFTTDRTSGSGDATVTFRVYENKYKDARQAVIVFKT